jgi:tRNA threonylcarbamoyladenosine biosynthesis protein TsaE|tara:strand:+ start:66 stop:539 length:474 start_codon:yes stop_codon:yes gene_type:complete
MNELELELRSVESHVAFGRVLAEHLRLGDVLALTGELGAGKTTLVRALGTAIGVSGMSSPTFGIIHEHDIPSGGRLMHIDAYRVNGPDELIDLGWDEWARSDDTIVCIEWAERVVDLLGDQDALSIELQHAEEGRVAVIQWGDASRLLSLAAWGDMP